MFTLGVAAEKNNYAWWAFVHSSQFQVKKTSGELWHRSPSILL
jgi:hypothetical protein